MSEKPIIFSGPMVRAILDGRKTQTRRIIKPQPWHGTDSYHGDAPECWTEGHCALCDGYKWTAGDLLWVRETWSHTGQGVWTIGDARMSFGGKVVYRADEDTPGAGWFPSIHMPKEFARIFLKVTNVRVERLQDISEEDAIAEGIQSTGGGRYWIADFDAGYTPRSAASMAFMDLWERINGERSREANPWVYALTFERVDRMSKAA